MLKLLLDVGLWVVLIVASVALIPTMIWVVVRLENSLNAAETTTGRGADDSDACDPDRT